MYSYISALNNKLLLISDGSLMVVPVDSKIVKNLMCNPSFLKGDVLIDQEHVAYRIMDGDDLSLVPLFKGKKNISDMYETKEHICGIERSGCYFVYDKSIEEEEINFKNSKIGNKDNGEFIEVLDDDLGNRIKYLGCTIVYPTCIIECEGVMFIADKFGRVRVQGDRILSFLFLSALPLFCMETFLGNELEDLVGGECVVGTSNISSIRKMNGMEDLVRCDFDRFVLVGGVDILALIGWDGNCEILDSLEVNFKIRKICKGKNKIFLISDKCVYLVKVEKLEGWKLNVSEYLKNEENSNFIDGVCILDELYILEEGGKVMHKGKEICHSRINLSNFEDQLNR